MYLILCFLHSISIVGFASSNSGLIIGQDTRWCEEVYIFIDIKPSIWQPRSILRKVVSIRSVRLCQRINACASISCIILLKDWYLRFLSFSSSTFSCFHGLVIICILVSCPNISCIKADSLSFLVLWSQYIRCIFLVSHFFVLNRFIIVYAAKTLSGHHDIHNAIGFFGLIYLSYIVFSMRTFLFIILLYKYIYLEYEKRWRKRKSK